MVGIARDKSRRRRYLNWYFLSPFPPLHAEFSFCDITDATRTRQVLSDAEHSLKLTQDELQTTREDLSDLFDPKGFGAKGEWKKLDGLCLEVDTGECVSFATCQSTGMSHLASIIDTRMKCVSSTRRSKNPTRVVPLSVSGEYLFSFLCSSVAIHLRPDL